jgi:hypothetical protein
MRRRDFITYIGGAATTSMLSPPTPRAQQSAMPVIGILDGGSPTPPVFRVASLRA